MNRLPNQACTLSAHLAVRRHCLRRAFAFTLDVTMQ